MHNVASVIHLGCKEDVGRVVNDSCIEKMIVLCNHIDKLLLIPTEHHELVHACAND